MSHVMELNKEQTESTVAGAVRKATLHRFSLKSEDVILPHGEGGSEPVGKLLAFPFRRKSGAARDDAKPHPKLDSKLSLVSLTSSAADADGSTTSRVPGREAKHSKRKRGVAGGAQGWRWRSRWAWCPSPHESTHHAAPDTIGYAEGYNCTSTPL